MEIIFIHGFLGSGKTTLVNRIIADYADRNIAVLVNELGNCTVDEIILENLNRPFFPANDGKLLGCRKTEKFAQLITTLIQKSYDYILVETSGYDDPITLPENMKAIIERTGKDISYYSITVVDGIYFPDIGSSFLLSKRQIQVADLLLLNKIDLLEEKRSRLISEQIKKLSKAPIKELEYCQVDNILDNLTHVNKPIMYGPRKRNMNLRYFSLKVDPRVSPQQLHEFLRRIRDIVYRCKGIVQLDRTKFNCQMASKQISMIPSNKTTTALQILYSSSVILESEILEIYRSLLPSELW